MLFTVDPMKRALAAVVVLGCAAALSAGSLYVLELKGGSRVFALDRPLEKGRVLVFHRHPDGVFTSIGSAEVLKIAPASAADRTAKFQPGDLMVLGHDVEGPVPEGGSAAVAPAAPSPTSAMPDDSSGGYGSYGYGYGYGSGVAHRSSPPRSLPPALVGPNGFPGTRQLPIGSNGFPDPPPRQ